MTFDLLTPKANLHICERGYICDQNRVTFFCLIFEIWRIYKVFGTQIHGLAHSKTECVRHRRLSVHGVGIKSRNMPIVIVSNNYNDKQLKV